MEKRYRVTLTEAERQELRAMVMSGKAAARKLVRARVLLLADQAEGGSAGKLEGGVHPVARAVESRQRICIHAPRRLHSPSLRRFPR